MPPEKQERIRTPTLGFFLPHSQVLFGTPGGQAMPLEPGGEEAGNRAEDQKAAPYKVGSCAGCPQKAYRHAGKNE